MHPNFFDQMFEREKQMGIGRGQDKVAKYVRGLNGDSLTFTKSGADISMRINEVLKKKAARSETAKQEIAEICKRRELDVEEVLQATDEQAVQTYSTKAEQSMGSGATMGLIRELQADLATLRDNTYLIESLKADNETLTRVQWNIEVERKFDLTYGELIEFGF